MKKQCEQCKFFLATPLQAKDAGQCRKAPPTVFCLMTQQGPQFISTWPSVQSDHYCGVFEAKESDVKIQ